MRLEDYWGIGPKTSALLEEAIGVEAAVQAIERGDVGALVDAGLPRGRATRILRHAHGGAAMDLLATRDARAVYKTILDLAVEFAVTEEAADRVRILTPLADAEAMAERLERVEDARAAWRNLEEGDRDALLAAFGASDRQPGDGTTAGAGPGAQGASPAGGDEGIRAVDADLAAVRTAQAIQDLEPTADVFDAIRDLDSDALGGAAAALAGLAGDGDSVGAGADDRLDELRG
jgi:DNA mismatch repair protein MutS2